MRKSICMNIHRVHLCEHSVGVMYFGNSPDIRHSPICERTAPKDRNIVEAVADRA